MFERSYVAAVQVPVPVGVCVCVCDSVMLSALTALGMLEVRVHWITHADLI